MLLDLPKSAPDRNMVRVLESNLSEMSVCVGRLLLERELLKLILDNRCDVEAHRSLNVLA